MKIRFNALNCLLDPTSGAARSVRAILEDLAARGHDVQSVTAASFDRPDHPDEASMLISLGFTQDGQSHWEKTENGVRHIVFPAGAPTTGKLSNKQIVDHAGQIMSVLEQDMPDVLVSYGGTEAENGIRSYVSRKGALNAFYLANPSYKRREHFTNVDLVLTDSNATAERYSRTLGLKAVNIGKKIAPFQTFPKERKRYITFINPSFEKGVTLFFRIASMMAQQVPEAVFQVIESRMSLQQVQGQTGLAFNRLENVRAIGPQRDMARAYARTKVLLIPSLWHESGTRSGLEALSLGIPVVGANHSGIAENIADGGTLITVPEPLLKEPRLIPPARVALPWVAALQDLMTDDEAYDDAVTAAKARWAAFNAIDHVAGIERLLYDLGAPQ